MNHLQRISFGILLVYLAVSATLGGESIRGVRSTLQVSPKVIPSVASLPMSDTTVTIGAIVGGWVRPELHEVPEEIFEEWKKRPRPEYDGKGRLTIDKSVELLGKAHLDQTQLSAAPTLSTNFEGNLNGGSRPGDLMVAVGPDHVISVANSTVRIRTKAGAVVQTVNANVFLGQSLLSSSDFFDPKVAYDLLENRYLVLFDYVSGTISAGYFLAVSQTSNPMGGWYVYYFDMKLDGATPTNNWADYPGLGFCDDLVVMTGNMYTLPTSTATFQYAKTRIVSKFDVYNGLPAFYSDILDVPGTGSHFTLKPAISLSPTAVQYLLITPSGGGSAVQLYKITGGVGTPLLEKIGHLSVSSHGIPPNGEQRDCPSTPIEGNDARTQDPVWRDGYLYAVNHVGVVLGSGTVSAIKYYKIDTDAISVAVDELFGAPSTFYSFPAVTVDAAGAAFFSFTRVSASEYAAAAYTGRRKYETSMQPSVILKAGVTAYWCTFSETRWGDYEGIAIDPSENSGTKTSAWADGNWAKSLTSWGSWIGKLSFNYHQLSGKVLHDCDSSAGTSGDRLPIELAIVSLYRDSLLVSTDTTAIDGSFTFSNLDDGGYDVELTIPAGSFSVDASPGSGGVSQTKLSSMRMNVTFAGAASASQISANNHFLIIKSHPVPVTALIAPSSYSSGEPDFILDVLGSNFIPCSVVRIDGSNRATTYISPTHLQATILASDIASTGGRSITVVSPSPDGGESNSQTLTIHLPAPVIALDPISINYGEILVGLAKTETVVVSNDGTADLVITSAATADGQFTVSPSGATIPRQTGREFQVTFAPSMVGASATDLIFMHNAATSPDSVTLAGYGNDSLQFRTATADNWADAVDAKGKHKAYPRKADKVFFKIVAITPANPALCFILDLTFSMEVNGLRAYTSPSKTDTIPYLFLTSDVKKKVWRFRFASALPPTTQIQIEGIGVKGKKVTAKYIWGDAGFAAQKKGSVPDDSSSFAQNAPGLPRPNLVNVADELFPKGFNQPSPYFAAGLVVGIPQGDKGAKSVKLTKNANVVKSFIDAKSGSKHTQGPTCLETFFDGKPISSQQSVLSPLKKNNKIFAELLALKLNLAASATSKFPMGFGELTFADSSDPANPFNELLVKDIAAYCDSLISCLAVSELTPSPTLAEASAVLSLLNGAFADTGNQKDTITFSPKTRLSGVRPVSERPFLRVTPGIMPESFFAVDVRDNDIPLAYALHQNYPNPFNPVTTIEFDLPEAATVTLKVFNLLGQEVATIIEAEEIDLGVHSVEFNAGKLASGIYFYRLTTNALASDDDENATGVNFTDIKKMLLVR